MNASILPAELQLLSLVVQGAFLLWVVHLIRRQRLSLRDSLLWLLTTVAAIVVTAFPRLLMLLAESAGIQVPSNAIFAAGLLYLSVNVLSVTLAASANAARVRRLAQECALLRAEVAALREGAPRERAPLARAER